ncbi:hypothetical protein Patl1_05630 [Pistacia atlantica]|uniref:Uncharacterized protein n=1 Tax=Pistacia atlantica TaxID=434234 RepID=A0ACC1BQU7_9ROSI|nr:hypothetical protein Patl1_05630 [Pistacia atlantica]
MADTPSTPDSPTSAGFNSDQLPPNTSQNYSTDDEAAVDPEIIRDEPDVPEEEEEGEDLYNDNFMDDYRRMDEHDQYESLGLDESLEDERDLDQIMADRRAAEIELDARDGVVLTNPNRKKLPQLLHDQDTDDDNYRPSKRSRADFRPRRSQDDTDGMQSSPRDDVPMTDATDDYPYEDDDGDDTEFEMYRVQGTLREWVTRDEVRRFIAKKFREFLLTYVSAKSEQGDFVYVRLINEMVSANKCSLEIDYKQFIYVHPNIAIWLADAPQSVLDVMEEVARKVVFDLHPNYKNIHQKIYVRITNLPVYDQIRNIRQIHLNTMIRIGGVVTRRSGVFPQLQQVKYDCNKCGAILGPFFQNSYSEVKVGSCPECQSKGPFTVNIEQTIYRNYQKLTLQESPGIVPAGRLPRYKEVILLNDLIDCARPGEEIEVTGVYTNNFDLSLNTKNGFPVFSTVVEANHVTKKHDLFSAYKLTQEDKEEIEKLSKDPRIGERIIKSIAPSIYGHEDIKTALALAMFGGQEKNVEGKHRLRGDINVLLLGDPGTAKSQFLKYVEKTGQRAVYTTGKGASAVGLTAAVHKDPVTREWTLEGGALVLADRGICLIDEFDKMNDQDRVSIHEAMEQQSISISKAGIVTSLQARCSVIAAANPVGGRYDSSKTFSQNVELTDPIISRFDVLCVVKDVVDPVTDEMLAKFVVDSHSKSQPKGTNLDEKSMNDAGEDIQASDRPVDPEILPQDLLKKYITYAKLNIFPRLHDSDMDKLTHVYAELRRESSHGQGVPIAVRHIESMIRMSEAHARMHLRQHVIQEDVDMAIRVLLDSFISTQKFGVQKALQKSFRKYMTFKKDYNRLLLELLRELVKNALHFEEIVSGYSSTSTLPHIDVKIAELQYKAQEREIYDLLPFFSSAEFSGAGFQLDEERGIIRHRYFMSRLTNLFTAGGLSLKTMNIESEGHEDYGLLVSEKAKKYAIVKELDKKVKLKGQKNCITEPPFVPSDKLSHVYTAIIRPDNRVSILVDGDERRMAYLLSMDDFKPPLIPPHMIPDEKDEKPEDWDDRPTILDPSAPKPDDWDEVAPPMIEDEDAVKPEGWLDDVPLEIDDPDASNPEIWDDEEDGEWEPPKVPNPKCASAPGCGKWKRPEKKNPAYKEKWKRPHIENPKFKGIWKPRMIKNPKYFEIDTPNFEPIAAIGIEIWTMQEDLLFDNIMITRDEHVASRYRDITWKPKYDVEKAKQKAEELASLDFVTRFQQWAVNMLFRIADHPHMEAYKHHFVDIIEKVEDQPKATLGIFISIIVVILTIPFTIIFSIKKSSASVNVAGKKKDNAATKTLNNQGSNKEKEDEIEKERESRSCCSS